MAMKISLLNFCTGHNRIKARAKSEVMKMIRTGRPKSDNPKNVRLEIRLTKSDADRLQNCADKLHTSRTEVILKGIGLVEKEIQEK